MRSRFLPCVGVMLALVLPGTASAQQLFDFDGQVLVPATTGNPLTMNSVLRDPAPSTSPLPLDFVNYEYTLVVTGLNYDGGANPQSYSGGSIAIYEDAGTAADHGSPATYTDGTAILTGTITSLTRVMFTATLGSATGSVDWTGGSEIANFAPADRLNWSFVSGISARANDVEPGYDENWDGKVEPLEPVVATEQQSFGGFKLGF